MSLHCPRGGGDIRLNFLTITTASSSSMDSVELTELSAEELLVNKPNSRILKVEAYISGNKLGQPFLTFAITAERKLDKSIPVVLVNGVWHNLIIKDKKGYAYQPYPSVHDFDLPEIVE